MAKVLNFAFLLSAFKILAGRKGLLYCVILFSLEDLSNVDIDKVN